MGFRTWLGRVLLRLVDRQRERETGLLLNQCAAAGTRVRLRQPVVVYAPERLSLGDDVDIGEFCHLRANGGLAIGSRVLIAAHAVITTRGHRIAPPRVGITEDAPVR